jgi:hypothetical protein
MLGCNQQSCQQLVCGKWSRALQGHEQGLVRGLRCEVLLCCQCVSTCGVVWAVLVWSAGG